VRRLAGFMSATLAMRATRERFFSLSTSSLSSHSPNSQRVSMILDRIHVTAIRELTRKMSTFEVGEHGTGDEEMLDESKKIVSSTSEIDDPEIYAKELPDVKYKRSDTVMKCPECEYRTYYVTTFLKHLRDRHSTTPVLSGISLYCECGHESFSNHHSITCKLANFTVMRTREGPIWRIEKKVTTPQKCIQCDVFPTTPSGYIRHLELFHRTTPLMSGIHLECACGVKIT
ncbi:hypothetical protein PMAYCL1PPCAC_08372, partial [Pristionchus mayeri]